MEKLINILTNYIKFERQEKIKYALDIGTKCGNMALALSKLGYRCITIDKNDSLKEQSKNIFSKCSIRNKPLQMNMDTVQLSFYNNSFDLVASYMPFQYFTDVKKVIYEMHRVCKPGGRIIIIDDIKTNTIKDILNELDIDLEYEKNQLGTIFSYKKKSMIDNKQSQIISKTKRIKLGEDDNNKFYYDLAKDSLITTNITTNNKVILNNKEKVINIVPTLCLDIANCCNLNCTYCYASGGNYGKSETKMDDTTAKEGLKWFKKNINENFHVIFFGGEPLLNKRLIKSVLSKKLKGLTYSINTNGTLLDKEIFKTLYDNNVKVSISIDGSRQTHNKLRVYNDGKPTYDNIINRLNNLTDKERQSLWARVTVSNQMVDIYDEIKSLVDIGFKKIDMSFVAGNIKLSETQDMICDWKKSIDKLAKYALEKWLTNEVIIHPFVKIFYSVLYGEKAMETCTAGRELLSLQPNGDIVPCFKFSNYVLGNIKEGINKEKVNEFEEYKKTQRYLFCKDCWAFKYCGGLCPKDTKTILKIQQTRCDLTRYLIKRTLFYFCSYYIKDQSLFNKQIMQKSVRNWLKDIKKEEDMVSDKRSGSSNAV